MAARQGVEAMGKRAWGAVAVSLVVMLMLLVSMATPADAGRGRGGPSVRHGGGGGWHGSKQGNLRSFKHSGWRGGHSSWRGGHSGWGGSKHHWKGGSWGPRVFLGFGVPFAAWGASAAYAYPYPVYTTPVEPPPPTTYIEHAPAQYWYYCQDPAGYYPYVTECPGGWLQVVPQPSPPPGP
jgi:hypothetical protein